MTHRCGRCHRTMTDAATLCASCTNDVRHALNRIVELHPHLLEAIGKRTAMGARSDNKPTKASEQPLPVDLHASRTATATRATLTGWTRVLAEDNQLPLPADTIPAICRWLTTHLPALRLHEAATEAADEITRAATDIARAVDLPEEKSRIIVGPCVASDEDGDPCPGVIYAVIPAEGVAGSPRMECRECGTDWPTIQWTRTGDLIRRRAKQIEMQKAYGRKA